MEHKTCCDCRESKPLSDYHKSAQHKSGVSGHCKPCQAAYHRQWYAKNRAKKSVDMRRVRLSRLFGLSLEDWDALYDRQNGGCAICGESDGYGRSDGAGRKRLSVDHDHQTGAVRGLLCDACNTGLGKFRDDPGLLAKAINYLAN